MLQRKMQNILLQNIIEIHKLYYYCFSEEQWIQTRQHCISKFFQYVHEYKNINLTLLQQIQLNASC